MRLYEGYLGFVMRKLEKFEGKLDNIGNTVAAMMGSKCVLPPDEWPPLRSTLPSNSAWTSRSLASGPTAGRATIQHEADSAGGLQQLAAIHYINVLKINDILHERDELT